jgi:hypothetical protein
MKKEYVTRKMLARLRIKGKTMAPQQQVGRLAFRVEGDKWTCYYAQPNTMEGAIWMGSVMMSIVEDKERKQAFMGLMRDALQDLLEDMGKKVESWNTQTAPESERSGSA